MLIQWRDAMSVDDGVIDQDHKALISIVNVFSEVAPSVSSLPQLRQIFDKLAHYTASHFGREEALQTAAQYPYFEAHHHEHKDLIRALGQLRERLDALAAVAENPDGEEEAAQKKLSSAIAELHAEIADFLHHWLVDHIVKSDLRLKPYVSAMMHHARSLPPLMRSAA